MRLLLLALALPLLAWADSATQLTDFELSDQNAKARAYRFPRARVAVFAVADHKGSEQLAGWIAKLYERFGERIDIEGVADVSMIAKPFHGLFRGEFRKRLAYPVMLDWGGGVVRQFGYKKGVANIYVVDRQGRIVQRMSGAVSEAGLAEVGREIDGAMEK